MKVKLLTVTAILLIAVACKKDQFTTRPQLEFKQVNGLVFSHGGLITFMIEFTDKEGDIDSIWIQRVSEVCPTTGDYITPVRQPMPSEFDQTKNVKAEFAINMAYNISNVQGFPYFRACGNKNDTAYFRFWVKDKAGNSSDTVASPNIVFLKP